MRANLFTIPAVSPGRLSTMPRPRGGDWLDDEMAALRDAGVDVVVCLLTATERDEHGLAGEADAAARAGINFYGFPIVDLGVPDHAAAAPLVRSLAVELAAGRHVAIHCRAGIGRSSLIAAAVLVHLGTPPDRAWTLIAEARGVAVPETEEQRQWIYRRQA